MQTVLWNFERISLATFWKRRKSGCSFDRFLTSSTLMGIFPFSPFVIHISLENYFSQGEFDVIFQ